MMQRRFRANSKTVGWSAIFVGYSDDPAGDTLKMLNLNTKRIWKSRDVCWIASSLTAYAHLQFSQMKAGKDDDDFDDKKTAT